MEDEPRSHSTPGLDFAASVIAVGAGAVIMIIALAVCFDVIMRWLFNSPVLWVADLNRYNYAVAIAAFFPLCMAGKRFIVVRALGGAFGPKVSNGLEVFGDFCTLLVFTAIAWQFYRYTQEVWSNGLTSFLLRVPQAPWWTVTTAIIGFCLVVQVAVLIRSIIAARRGETVVFAD